MPWTLEIGRTQLGKKSTKITVISFRTKTEMVSWAAAHGGKVALRDPRYKYQYRFVR